MCTQFCSNSIFVRSYLQNITSGLTFYSGDENNLIFLQILWWDGRMQKWSGHTPLNSSHWQHEDKYKYIMYSSFYLIANSIQFYTSSVIFWHVIFWEGIRLLLVQYLFQTIICSSVSMNKFLSQNTTPSPQSHTSDRYEKDKKAL